MPLASARAASLPRTASSRAASAAAPAMGSATLILVPALAQRGTWARIAQRRVSLAGAARLVWFALARSRRGTGQPESICTVPFPFRCRLRSPALPALGIGRRVRHSWRVRCLHRQVPVPRAVGRSGLHSAQVRPALRRGRPRGVRLWPLRVRRRLERERVPVEAVPWPCSPPPRGQRLAQCRGRSWGICGRRRQAPGPHGSHG